MKARKNKHQMNSNVWNSTQDLEILLKVFGIYDFANANIIAKTDLEHFLSEIKTSLSNNKETYVHRVNLPQLYFSFKADQMAVIPHGIQTVNVILSLNYEYSEPYLELYDIFSFYQLNLVIKSYDGKMFAWHLDKECDTDGKFIHPLYHFHGGGKRIENKEAGELLILSSPRLAHPPLDLFLAIHFILENFLNTQTYAKQAGIFTNPQYQDIMIRAQKRVLDPYYSAIADVTKTEGYYHPHSLCPLYLEK